MREENSKNWVAVWSTNSLLDGRDDAFEFCLIENEPIGKGNEKHTRKPIFRMSDKIKRWNVFRWLFFLLFFFLLFVCFPCYCLCLSIFVEYVRFILEHYWKSNDPTTIEIIDVRAANHKSFQIREIVLTLNVSEWSVFVFCEHFFFIFTLYVYNLTIEIRKAVFCLPF